MIEPKKRNEALDKLAENTPGSIRTKDGVMIKFDWGFYHVTDITSINSEGYKKYGDIWNYYQPICNDDDIDRILNQRCAKDFLLSIQAEGVLEKPRFLRVFRKRFNNSKNVSLSSYYNKNNKNDLYLNELSKGNQAKLNTIPAGSALMDRLNAACVKSKFGSVIFISEKLEYLLYYMNIFIYSENIGFTTEDSCVALMLGLRIYFGYESLDFDLDPRGDFPEANKKALDRISKMQYSFILGHEYSHILLGHLSDKKLRSEFLFKSESDKRSKVEHYIHRFKEEYDADWCAIKNIKGNSNFKEELANAAFTALLIIYAAQKADEYINPRGKNSYHSHPSPIDRIWNIRRRLDNKLGFEREHLESSIEYVDKMVDHFLTHHLPFNFDEFERYGSTYFSAYKDKILRDRFDY
ncbi:hypothetical protein [Serratia ureilytica]|uniref:hypothetical protein n=1 Tax=Serratia ureilytica TaxID=300181 RepID=UPI001C11EEAA|nr:hypothetical protein [Serratia ureilytica]MBU5411361.1 hypothetical protein [Serratia ureilytica]